MYISGDPWAICDRCGFKVRKSKTKKTWDGLIVCLKDFEPRHPQEVMVEPKDEKQSVKDARPVPTVRYVGTVTADDL